MLTAADIDYDRIKYEAARRTSQRAFDLLTAKSKPRPGDILLTKDGSLGRVAILDRDNVCVNQSVAVLQLYEQGQARFLVDYFLSPEGQTRMMADAGGSTIKHIYISRLANMLVPMPPPEEALVISEVALELSACIRKEGEHLRKLRGIKEGLMGDLLTGRVRVHVESRGVATG